MTNSKKINPFQPSDAFHIETICCANQMTGFYIKCNTGLKWIICAFAKDLHR